MRITFLKFLVTPLAVYLLLTACQQSTGTQGGIVDNGNKLSDPNGPINDPINGPVDDPINGPTTSSSPIAKTKDDKIKDVQPSPPVYTLILSARHAITIPLGELSVTDNLGTTRITDRSKHNALVATLVLDSETICRLQAPRILTTADGGELFKCSDTTYELKASNGDRIIVTNHALESDVLQAILRSIEAKVL